MFPSRVLIIFLVLTGVPVYAITIKAPGIAENGAVIPVEIRLDTPLTTGQRLELLVNDQPAAQVRMIKGKLAAFSTRVKGSQSSTTIAARVIANGSELDSASRTVAVNLTPPVGGPPTPVVGDMKIRAQNGDLKVLMNSENGFAGTLVLQATGFRAEISGSSVLSKNPLIGVNGDFSDQITASIDERARQAAPAKPESVPEQRADDTQGSREVIGRLTGALLAAAGGKNSAERTQLALGALAEGEPSTGTSASSQAVTGGVGISDQRRSRGIPGARPARITSPDYNPENDATDCLEVSRYSGGYKYINNCPYDLSFMFFAGGDLNRGIGGPTGGKGGGTAYTWNPLYYGNESHTYIACRSGKMRHHGPTGILGCY